jgi:hypothetical protein
MNIINKEYKIIYLSIIMATNNENINECYICLENIYLNEDNFLELTCCKHQVHITCFKEWYNKTNSSTCFICNQTNTSCINPTKLIHYIQIQPVQPVQHIQPVQSVRPNFIIYTKNKLTALVFCYIVNFFILINLIVMLS